MPRSFVTSTQAAPSNCRYSAAWSSTLERSALLSSRSRNCGTSALTPLMPMNVAVRPDRNAWTPRRTPARARRIDWSAVRSACTVVRPSVTPSTAAIDSVAATKIFAPRPSRAGLVALESLIRGVVLAVLVLVRHPAEAARVQLYVDSHDARRRDPHGARHLGAPLVPDVQRVRARRDVGNDEAAVARRLREQTAAHHLDEGHHAGVDVAKHTHQPRMCERLSAGLPPPIPLQVELVGVAGGEDVVVERIAVGEAYRRADRDHQHAGDEFLVAGRDLDREGVRCGASPPARQGDYRGPKLGRRLSLLLEHRDAARDARPALRHRDRGRADPQRDPAHRPPLPVALEALQLTVVGPKPPGGGGGPHSPVTPAAAPSGPAA